MIMAKKRRTQKAEHAKAKTRKAPAKAKARQKKAAAKRKPAKARQQAKQAQPKIAGRFNMIITFDPSHAGTAEAELKAALGRIGEKAAIARTEAEGLIKAKVSDARKAVEKLTKLCRSDSQAFKVTHHYTPIDNWCKSELKEMQKAIKAASAAIGQSEKWRLGLNKRHWDKLEGTKLILKLTEVIERDNVDLTNPDKIVQVEIIGKEAGISLLKPEEILDAQKTRS